MYRPQDYKIYFYKFMREFYSHIPLKDERLLLLFVLMDRKEVFSSYIKIRYM